MLTSLARWRHACLSVAFLVLLTAFAAGRAQAHVPALAEPFAANAHTAQATAHCHTDDAAAARKQANACKSFCAIGSQERLSAPASGVPAPSTAIKFYVATPSIGATSDIAVARTAIIDTPPPPLRRLVRDRRLLI